MVPTGCSMADCTAYLRPAPGQPAAAGSHSITEGDAPWPRHPRAPRRAQPRTGSARLRRPRSSELRPGWAAAVRFVRAVGVIAGTAREEPGRPGQHGNHPGPCSRERGSWLRRQRGLHFNLTDGPGLLLFIWHLPEASRRLPASTHLPAPSRAAGLRAPCAGQQRDQAGDALQTPPQPIPPHQTPPAASLGSPRCHPP